MQAADTRSRLLADGSEVMVSTPEEFEKRIIDEIGKWTRVNGVVQAINRADKRDDWFDFMRHVE